MNLTAKLKEELNFLLRYKAAKIKDDDDESLQENLATQKAMQA